MSGSAAQKIRYYLEKIYDVPFDVSERNDLGDQCYIIKPHNDENELFSITVRFKNRIRLIIEVVPEKYAAFSIKDMAASTIEKKRMFSEYARQLNIKRAKTEFYINGTICDVLSPDTWPTDWNNYRLRVSRSPICAENEDLNEAEVASSWAAIVIGMFMSLLEVISLDDSKYAEGGVKRTEVNRYERNPINRELCLASNGYTCKICGFNFEEHYGEYGRHFIHVHHIIPVSYNETSYYLDPVKDLIPVCPNCHAMLHHKNPPLEPSELADIMMLAKEKSKP